MILKKFEDYIEVINKEIAKRKSRWHLDIISWFNFEDVSQILRLHIHRKFSQFDQTRPIEPWLSRMISNQIKNLLRNHYGSLSRPCLKCSAAEGEGLCSIYTTQNNECPLYHKWEKTKKQAYNVKLPVSLVHHEQEIYNNFITNANIDKDREEFEAKLKTILTAQEFKFYDLHFIEQLSDQQVALELSPAPDSESPATRLVRFNKVKKSVIEKTKAALESGDLEITYI